MRRLGVALLVGGVVAAGCAAQEEVMNEPEEIVLGPANGLILDGSDLDRVQEGQMAPDFTLESLAGPPVWLAGFRGKKNVVLVFYRGHW